MPIGYSTLTYEELGEVRLGEIMNGSNTKPFFYVFDDGLVEKMKDSKLISELITYKETILLHLKRKTKKWFERCFVDAICNNKYCGNIEFILYIAPNDIIFIQSSMSFADYPHTLSELYPLCPSVANPNSQNIPILITTLGVIVDAGNYVGGTQKLGLIDEDYHDKSLSVFVEGKDIKDFAVDPAIGDIVLLQHYWLMEHEGSAVCYTS